MIPPGAGPTHTGAQHEPGKGASTDLRLIDCDVHHDWRAVSDIFPYLPAYWISFIQETGATGTTVVPNLPYFKIAGGGMRVDARPDDGSPPGSDRDLLRHQLLDAYHTDYAILTGAFANIVFLPNVDFSIALARAINDWMIDYWLAYDSRLKGALTVPLYDPQAAVAEIERLGGHPDIVEILIPVASRMPYGQRFFHPIWEACARHGLPVGIHFGGTGLSTSPPPTSVGWPSYYLEWHTNMS